MKRRRAQTTQPIADRKTPTPSQLPTFLEHLYELRRRLFWVVAVIAVAASATYPFLDTIISVLRAPLGSQQLYYLTPVGGLSFSIKICMYMGVMLAVPFIMYHLYRFLEPLMSTQWRKSAFFYVGLSSFLAVIGVVFAYYVSLPGALQFLTGLNLSHIQAMLTVDSYLSFVITYLLGAAILFQIPLLLLIINTMTPFKPGTLGKSQRFVIVAAFIIAAIISPTPDLMNQIIFALPIVVMYEVGVTLVWFQNRNHARKKRKEQLLAAKPAEQAPAPEYTPRIPQPKPVMTPAKPAATVVMPKPVAQRQPIRPRPTQQPRYADIMVTNQIPRRQTPPLAPPQPRQAAQRPRTIQVPARSIDGFMPYRPRPANSS